MNSIVSDQVVPLTGNGKVQPQSRQNSKNKDVFDLPKPLQEHDIDNDSLVAAAGSNGAVVVWRASSLLGLATAAPIGTTASGGDHGLFQQRQHRSTDTPTSTAVVGSAFQPEAVLIEHSRAVNRLAWHNRRPGLLLTASQDSTVKLWERRQEISIISSSIPSSTTGVTGIHAWFGSLSSSLPPSNRGETTRSFSWHCTATFAPKSDSIRDIQWSPFDDNGKCSSCGFIY